MREAGAAALVVLLVALAGLPREAAGQAQLRLSGRLETSAGAESVESGGKSRDTGFWGLQYAPNLDGFIWSPRFLTFSVGGQYGRQQSNLPEGEATSVQWDPYRILVTLFPQAAHSLEGQASRSVSDTTFAVGADPLTTATTTTTEREALTYRYRGSARLPEASVVLRHDATESDTLGRTLEETRTALEVRARKVLATSQPSLGYVAELRRTHGTANPFQSVVSEEGLSHSVQYDDRIRVGPNAVLTPLAQLRVSEDSTTASSALQLTGALSPTLDGSAGARYAFQELRHGPATHTVAADGVLTRRVSPALTLTTGGNGVVVGSDDLSWSAGVFGGASAQPTSHLQASGDYGVQAAGGGERTTVNHRAHVGLVSTLLPQHTVGADYFVIVFDRGSDRPLFVGHDASITATSLALPLTTLSAGYRVGYREGDGDELSQGANLGAVVTPVPAVSLRLGVDGLRKSSHGASGGAVEERGWGVEASVSASPLSWLSLSLGGRHAEREVARTDRTETFVSEQLRGSTNVVVGPLSLDLEGFLERESAVELARAGARGRITYRFRIWRFSLEAEHSQFTAAGVASTRERYFVRVSRPIEGFWRF